MLERGVFNKNFVLVIAQRVVESVVEVRNNSEGHEIHDYLQEGIAGEDYEEINDLDSRNTCSLKEARQESDRRGFKAVRVIENELHVVHTAL